MFVRLSGTLCNALAQEIICRLKEKDTPTIKSGLRDKIDIVTKKTKFVVTFGFLSSVVLSKRLI